jgi:hypothetical protein
MFVGAILKGTLKDSDTVPANTYGSYIKIEERILDYTTNPAPITGKVEYHYKLACRSIDIQGFDVITANLFTNLATPPTVTTDCMMVPEDDLENSLMYGYYEFWTPPGQDRWEDME